MENTKLEKAIAALYEQLEQEGNDHVTAMMLFTERTDKRCAHRVIMRGDGGQMLDTILSACNDSPHLALLIKIAAVALTEQERRVHDN